MTETVPGSREEARVEREPTSKHNVDEALTGPEISDEKQEVVHPKDERG